MKSITLILIPIVCGGCLSQKKINACIESCPEYMQKNIGTVKYLPWHPLGVAIRGTTWSNGNVELYIMANKFTVYHELMHSFLFKMYKNNRKECENFWQLFVRRNDYSFTPLIVVASIYLPPLLEIPIADKNRLNGAITPHEDMADTFGYWMMRNKKMPWNNSRKKYKVMLIDNFTQGNFGPHEDGPIK